MLRNPMKFVFQSDISKVKNVSSHIKISSVTTLKDFKDFFRIPWTVYQNDKYWVAPFWLELKNFFRKKNTFWTHAETRLFVAYMNNSAVGRIAAFIDQKYCRTSEEKVGFFGFFECIQDFRIASALFKIAKEWLASKGISLIRGPINGRVDVRCGFLYEGFNSAPSLLSSYSPKYYLDFVKKFGMKESRDQLVYYVDLTQPIPECVTNAVKRCESKGVKIRKFNRRRAGTELNWWTKLILETFSEHWGVCSCIC